MNPLTADVVSSSGFSPPPSRNTKHSISFMAARFGDLDFLRRSETILLGKPFVRHLIKTVAGNKPQLFFLLKGVSLGGQNAVIKTLGQSQMEPANVRSRHQPRLLFLVQ